MKRILAVSALFLASLGLSHGQEEPKGRGYIPPTPEQRALFVAHDKAQNGPRVAMMARNQTLPAAFDARDKGWVMPTGDQGSCGSCYLCATVRQMSCAYIKGGWGKPDGSFALAWQYGMDRPRSFGGCGGGNGTEVIAWAVSHGWIAEQYIDSKGVVHKDYPPYRAGSGSDQTAPGAKVWMKDATWGYVHPGGGSPTTEEWKAAIVNFGVLNVSLDAGGQFGSGTGTITSLGRSIDHEICCVGYDDAKDGGSLLLNNQWGTSWGNGGYRWCTYKAAQNIVDPFWVSATPLTPPDPPPVPPGALTVVPAVANLLPGATQQFIVSPTAAVNWTATAGGITPAGLFTAPSSPGSYVVTASMQSDSTKTGSASVTVSTTPPPPVPGDSVTFPADVKAGTYIRLIPGMVMIPAADKARLDAIDAMYRKAIEDKIPEPFQLKPRPPTPEPPEIKDEPAPKPKKLEEAKQAEMGYWQARALALGSEQPLVLGIGTNPPEGYGWYVAREKAPWNGYRNPCVVLAVPERGDLWERKVYPPGVTAGTVALALGR